MNFTQFKVYHIAEVIMLTVVEVVDCIKLVY